MNLIPPPLEREGEPSRGAMPEEKSEYFVCGQNCTFASQRWYPGDKMPASYVKDGKPPKHFMLPKDYLKLKEKEEREKHENEVRRKLSEMRSDDPSIKAMTQGVLNKMLGTGQKVQVPETPIGKNWKGSMEPAAGASA
jgi:hypothetical protein